jgi:hypothetical protein
VSAVRPIAFNGKFRAGKHNGVSRVADRLIREVDSLLSQMPPDERPPVRLIVPSGCPPEEPYRARDVALRSREAWFDLLGAMHIAAPHGAQTVQRGQHIAIPGDNTARPTGQQLLGHQGNLAAKLMHGGDSRMMVE